MGKIGKNLANLLRKTAFVSSIAVPLVFSGCEPEEPEPPITKSIEQSVALNNDIEIKYSATLSNVDKAELNVKREGVLISTKEINDVNQSGADYQNTFTYAKDGITKGNYEFTLTSDNLEKKNSVEIQNYKPTGNFTNLNLNVEGNSETNLTLPSPSDKNPEDNPVPFTNAKPLDIKTSVRLDGNNLSINPIPGYTGSFDIELEYGSESGGLEKSMLMGNIIGDNRIEIDPFTYIYNPNAVINTLTNKTARDNLIQTKLDGDWTYTIPPSNRWACGHYTMQEMINSNYFGENIHTNFRDWGDDLLYNGNKSKELEIIYQNHGTLADIGELELPMGIVSLHDTSHYGGEFGHSMNWVATGDNLREFKDINFIEPQQPLGNVQPGETRSLLPKNCDEVFLEYYYIEKVDNKNYLETVTPAKFRLENGVGILIWENNDPRYNIRKQREK